MSDTSSLKGKRILITSFSYAAFGGAELNAVELADQLVEFGMIPTFFSYDIDGPLKGYIEDRFKTTVLTDQINKLSESDDENEMGITKLDINNYDYIWVGGNTVPISLLKQINTARNLPKFIFVHMSSLIAFPLDAPLMPDFEKEIASKILSIGSKTTTDNIQRILGEDMELSYWCNPVPVEFSRLKKRGGVLRKIAVISSSHPSDEIIEIKSIIESQGIEIDYIGPYNNNVKAVNANIYDEYDLVIGIGKNVRYSLVSGVPSYVYGRFGGSGYVSEGRPRINGVYDFSGRGFGRKDAETIAREVISGYRTALEFHEKNRERFIKEFSIDNISRNLFISLEKEGNKQVKFSDRYINWIISTQINLMQRHHRTAWLRRADNRVQKLEAKVESDNKKINILKNDIDKLLVEKKIAINELRSMRNSLSWKITEPLRYMNSVRKGFTNRSKEG